MIGGSSQAPKSIVGTRRGHSRSYFVIEGEDIANAVFERFDVASFKVSPREFDKVVSDALQKRGAAATKTAMGKKNASKTRK